MAGVKLAYTFDRKPKGRADYDLRRRYGIGADQKKRMYDEQHGLCDLCARPLSTNFMSEACVDHRHRDGKIRGLVHRMCNLIIAALEDNPSIISQGHSYLRKWNGA